MEQIKIAEFKSKLSANLKKVRSGQELIILDRDHPIAQVLPFRKKDKLTIIPAKNPKGWRHLKLKPAQPRSSVDVVHLLREDRDKR